MKEFICKKDYYIEDVQFSKVGDHVILLQDNCTVVNTNGGQKCMNYPNIVKDLEYFSPTFEVSPKFPNNMNNLKDNKVDHPKHYNQGSIECIDAMIAAFGKETVEHFCICNAFKYLWRSEFKNGSEDIKKALWYLTKHNELRNEH